MDPAFKFLMKIKKSYDEGPASQEEFDRPAKSGFWFIAP
jgi:hypothetical protein